MSSEEAEAIRSYYEHKDASQKRRTFISRMEHKLNRKERSGRY